MRRLLLAAAALVAVLLLFFLLDAQPGRHESRAPGGPLSRKDQRHEPRGDQDGAPSVGRKTKPADDGRTDIRWGDPDLPFTWHRAPMVDFMIEVLYEDGTPAAGATVGHTFNAGQPNDDSTTATTNAMGIAKLRTSASLGWYFARRGSLVAGPVGLFATPGGRHKLILGEAHSIRGVVLMPDGRPATRARLSFSFWDGWEWRFVDGHAAPDGTFDCRPVPLRWIKRMRVYVTQKGVTRNQFEWPRPATDLTLQLTSETVRGRVIYADDGSPAYDVHVYAKRKSLRTDKDGRFEVALQRREGALIRVNKMIRVLKANDRDIEIVLKPGRPLHGRLLAHDRKPVMAAWVSLSMPVGPQLASAGTDRDGRFQFLALAEGPHNLRFRLKAGVVHAPDYLVGDVHATDQLLEVVLPKPIRARVRLRREDGRVATTAKHVALIVRKDGHELFKRTWPTSKTRDELPFFVWQAGAYGVQVTTAFHEPSQFLMIRITETGRNVFDLALKKRRHVR